MTGRERIEALLAGRPVDRPPFCPAVYEHKAALIGVPPSEPARDPGLLLRALEREAELYDPDILTVGVDVYNVEAEALGARVRFPASNEVPSLEGPILRPGEDPGRLRLPDPERDGRMPVFLEAGRRAGARFGRERLVRGAMAAPFSIAAGLAGPEELLVAMVEEPAWVVRLLAFAGEVAKAYGRAWARRGLGVVLFDSHASPPLVSPALFRRIVLPAAASVIGFLKRDLGVPLVPYILGGDTGPILDEILASGTNNVLCDFKADLPAYVRRLAGKPVLLRANLDPGRLASASEAEIQAQARALLSAGLPHPGFMLGTGILPYDLPPAKAAAVRAVLVP